MKPILAMILLASASLAAEKPNILFIAVDDLKPVLGCYGDKHALTPNIDKLAGSGATLLNAHCSQAVCGPSRASLLTGLRPDRSKVHDLQTKIRKVSPWVTTLPQHFKNNGYTTLGVGKIYDPRSVDQDEDAESWSEPYPKEWTLKYAKGQQPVAAAYQNPEARAAAGDIQDYQKRRDTLKAKNLWYATESADVPDEAYVDGAIRLKAEEFIRRAGQAKTPFFMAVGFKKPHLPFVAPKKYWDLYQPEKLPKAEYTKPPEGAPSYALTDFYELREYDGVPPTGPVDEKTARNLVHGYYACTSYIDAQIGILLKTLEECGIANNTIVVLWGDHGWHLGDHGLWCKHTNFEQATRLPLIIAGPGVKSSIRSSAPTDSVDIYATLCDLAGIATPQHLDSESFAPVLSGRETSTRKVAVSQFGRGQRIGYAFRGATRRYVVWLNRPESQDATPTIDGQIAAEELYDYSKDPLETRNLLDDPAQAGALKFLRAEASAFFKTQAARTDKQH